MLLKRPDVIKKTVGDKIVNENQNKDEMEEEAILVAAARQFEGGEDASGMMEERGCRVPATGSLGRARFSSTRSIIMMMMMKLIMML